MAWDKQMPAQPVVAVAGVTGAVGREMLKVLEQRGFPYASVKALASARSAGKKLPFAGGELTVEEMTPESFDGVDIALFSAGAGISKEFREAVTSRGAVMIDNSSAFRMDDDVPLVVPEVNPEDVAWHSGVIANPNCSTIQMVVALKPLDNLAKIKRVVVSSYQAASGAGAAAMEELYTQSRDFLMGQQIHVEQFAHRIAFNCIPQIDVFMDDGSTKEEWKMVVETKKIMHQPDLEVSATCVRVPVLRCHSESINVEFAEPAFLGAILETLESGEGITILDDREAKQYPMPALLEGTDDVYIGRIRKDPSVKFGINMWVVADQLRRVVDGVAALAAAEEYCPDLIILDLMLPGIDGLEVARTLRSRELVMPILMLTARSETQDVVTGFDAGADDYLRKPFEIPELLSRVHALLKRSERDRPMQQYKVGNIEIDPSSRSVSVAGDPINFTAKEYDLLEFFVANAGRVISRDEILETVWGGQHTTDSNVIEVFVCHLRNKIEDRDNQIIRTIRGVGYFFSRT